MQEQNCRLRRTVAAARLICDTTCPIVCVRAKRRPPGGSASVKVRVRDAHTRIEHISTHAHTGRSAVIVNIVIAAGVDPVQPPNSVWLRACEGRSRGRARGNLAVLVVHRHHAVHLD